jgi:hypothetical protein
MSRAFEGSSPSSSFEFIRRHNVPYFETDMRRLGAAIEHPPTWSGQKKAGIQDLPTNVRPEDDPVDDE